jgi:hypothetical protein
MAAKEIQAYTIRKYRIQVQVSTTLNYRNTIKKY